MLTDRPTILSKKIKGGHEAPWMPSIQCLSVWFLIVLSGTIFDTSLIDIKDKESSKYYF